MKRPLIAMTTSYMEKKDAYVSPTNYLDTLRETGGVPVIVPYDITPEEAKRYARIADGLMLTGGVDVEPSFYHHNDLGYSMTCPRRDAAEKLLIDAFLEADKSILAICRGVQILNASLGGTLYQDLPALYQSNTRHYMRKPYDRHAHYLRVLPATPLFDLWGTGQMQVNSCHHQGIMDLASPLLVMAEAEDRLIEGVYMPDRKFVWGVQWHPEKMFRKHPEQLMIIDAFVKSASKR
ncbi:MAG: gamma-glutamyl-gamma-aminobutyrate hydrolase family protein [Eubacteriaceae bacterium]|nr:gamma-glutamyl-gamma-aminobutyrate hydrolase family protein [Eubacteriaceae bacterium]